MSARRIKKQPTKKRKPKGSWPPASKWIAMGTLLAYSAVGSKTQPQAIAQEPRPRTRAVDNSGPVPNLTVLHFSIPAGPLAEVLPAFQKISGMQVLVPNDAIFQIESPGVAGPWNAAEALKRILANTGLTYHFVGPTTVTLQFATMQTSIDVTAAPDAVPLPRYTQPLQDTPQSISILSPQLMKEQGATTLRDVLRNVAGISLAAGEGGSQGDNLTIRGFTARNDIFLDGMRDFGSYYRDPFDMESVEVLEGASSVTFGRGSTGGIINQQSKSPQAAPLISGAVDLGTDLTRRGTLDVNQPLEILGQPAAFRLNLMGHDAKVADRDVAESRRFGVAPSLAFGLGMPTRATLSYFHQSADDTPDYGIPWLFNGPAPVARQNYYGFRDGNYLRTNADVVTTDIEHDFSHAATLRNQARYARYTRNARITEARVPTNLTWATPLDAIPVARNQIAVNSVESFLDDQLDLTSRVRTGFLHHNAVAGVEGGRETSSPIRYAFTGVPGTGLLDPDENQPFSGSSTVSSQVHTTATSFATYALDTVELGYHLQITGGVRFDRFDAGYNQSVAPASAFSRVDNMTSWRGAVVYKPVSEASFYFSSGTSFNPSAESLSLSAGTANTPPEKNRSYEVGSKLDIKSGVLSLRAALFRTDKTNAREPDPDNPLLNVLGGSQRVQGGEVGISGRVTSRLQIYMNYARLNSKVTKSNYYPASVGAQLANVPKNNFNLWTNYQLPWHHISAGLGTQFVDRRTASSTAPLDSVTGLVKQVPGYWVVNAMAKYPLGERVDVQCNLYNLANRYYYDEIHPAHIVPGAGRSAMIGINFNFATGKKN